jgi:pimeloyl-ACP methyl ester carboxylesterase
MNHVISKNCVTAGGTVISYSKEGSGPPMLLLHGPEESSSIWCHDVAPLSRYFSLYVLDLPLVDETDSLLCSNQTLERSAEALYQFMCAMDIDRAHLVGSSLGGTVATLFCHRYPRKIHRLVLINAVGLRGPGHSLGEYSNLFELGYQILLHHPVLIISGELTPLGQREAARSIAARNLLARFVVVPTTGTGPPEENPKAVAHYIISFCVETPVDVLCG